MKFILFISIFALTLSATAQTGADDIVTVSPGKHDFGKIKQGIPLTYFFEIKNISNKPVVVENTSASCGCTTPDKIKDPIMPGKTAKLKIVYNAAAMGAFTKDIYIKFAGVNQPKTVHITGEVVTK